jgi:ABC-type uncharacterized transport system involved in gliding motility auxiliary subunit
VEVTVATRAPILGIAGLIFLFFGILSHWLSYNPADGFLGSLGWFSLAHFGVGVACLVAYFTRGSGSLSDFVRRRSTKYGLNAVAYSLIFLALFVMINFLGARYSKRFDMSAGGVNSLSEQSRKVLAGLAETVDIDAFVEDGRDTVLEELLEAYKYESERVTVRVLDPQLRPELAQEAGVAQVPTLRIRMADRSTLVTNTDEEAVTNGIRKVTSTERKKIYFVDGHGEPNIDDKESIDGVGLFAEALQNQNYEVAKLFLPEAQGVPADAAAVLLLAPERELFPQELALLDAYMRRGGRVLFLLEPQKSADLVAFLAKWGVAVEPHVILDQQMRLFQGVTLGLDPVVASYAQHPAVKSMTERTLFSLARPVHPASELPKGLLVQTIASTAKTSWAESDLELLFKNSQAEFDETKDLPGPVSLAVAASAYSKDIGGEGDSEFQMAVFGDASFATNKYWRQLFNDALALSVVGWLAGEADLMSIGSRAVRASRASLSPAQALSVFYLSVLVLPELILLCGIVVWWRRTSS